MINKLLIDINYLLIEFLTPFVIMQLFSIK